MKKKSINIILGAAMVLLGIIVSAKVFFSFPSSKAPVAVKKRSIPEAMGKPFNAEKDMIEVKYKHLTFWIDKDNPGFTEDQAGQIESIILNEKPPLRFDGNPAINRYYNTLMTPAQNGSTGGLSEKTKLGYFTSFYVQVPYKPIYRVFIYNSPNQEGPWKKFADFVDTTYQLPSVRFELSGNKFFCYDEIQSNRIMYAKDIP